MTTHDSNQPTQPQQQPQQQPPQQQPSNLSPRTSTLRKHLTLSGGGSRKINLKLSSDLTHTQKRQYIISSLLAGVGSGSLASIICAPLDLIRTRLQVAGEIAQSSFTPSTNILQTLRDIIRQDGFRGCFRGLGATLVTVPTFWGIYFPLYEYIKDHSFQHYTTHTHSHLPSEQQRQRVPHVVHMGSAILAGAVADFVCNPMFVVRTRMQTEALHVMENGGTMLGIGGTVRNLWREGGVTIFWRGLTASLMGLSHVAIQFPVYEWFKAEARARNTHSSLENPLDLLLASGISKITASLVTYPHEVIRSRMMDCRRRRGLVETFRYVLEKEGFKGLYSGLHVSLVRVVPNCCITFVSYELILRWSREYGSGRSSD